MLSRFNQTVACPRCHHTDHALSKELHTYKFFYGRVQRPALFCTHCPCTTPVALPAWLWMKWSRRDWRDNAT
jgi:hypothetical protein